MELEMEGKMKKTTQKRFPLFVSYAPGQPSLLLLLLLLLLGATMPTTVYFCQSVLLVAGRLQLQSAKSAELFDTLLSKKPAALLRFLTFALHGTSREKHKTSLKKRLRKKEGERERSDTGGRAEGSSASRSGPSSSIHCLCNASFGARDMFWRYLLLVMAAASCVRSRSRSRTASMLIKMSYSAPKKPLPSSSVAVRNLLATSTVAAMALGSYSSAANAASPQGPLTKSESSDKENEEDRDDFTRELPLGADAYTDLKGMRMCKLLNGMWQVSGAHGYEPERNAVVSEMTHCADEGYTTFDLADIYGPAEDFVGSFRRGNLASSVSKDCHFFTKWVPRPTEITKAMTTAAIDRSLRRMNIDRIDLLQFHWWDYSNPFYYDAMDHLMSLQQGGKLRQIGLTNFDTKHMVDLMDQDAPIVSNQVSFSILDTRPLQQMVPASLERGVKLLVYGSLLGGFLSSSWLNKPEPFPESLTNVSLRKYLPWIQIWGGWPLFQELLSVLDVVAKKHSVSISNVALRWVLDQQAVGGAIVGVRLGLKEHLKDNRKVFSFKLDEQDLAAIKAVQSKSKDLMTAFGDCGGEYRRRG